MVTVGCTTGHGGFGCGVAAVGVAVSECPLRLRLARLSITSQHRARSRLSPIATRADTTTRTTNHERQMGDGDDDGSLKAVLPEVLEPPSLRT